MSNPHAGPSTEISSRRFPAPGSHRRAIRGAGNRRLAPRAYRRAGPRRFDQLVSAAAL